MLRTPRLQCGICFVIAGYQKLNFADRSHFETTFWISFVWSDGLLSKLTAANIQILNRIDSVTLSWQMKDSGSFVIGTTMCCCVVTRCWKTCLLSSNWAKANPSPGALRAPPSPTRGEGKRLAARARP